MPLHRFLAGGDDGLESKPGLSDGVLSNGKPEKVASRVALLSAARMRDAGFPWLQFQPHPCELLSNDALALFYHGSVFVYDDQIIGGADDRGGLLLGGNCVLEAVFQAVEGNICQEWGKYTSYKVANMLVEFSTSIPRTQLRPGYGDGFLGAPLHTVLPPDKPASREQGGRRGTSSTHPHHNPGGAHHI